MVEDRGAERTLGHEGALRGVGVVQVPNVGANGHLGAHLLEPENGITHTNSGLGILVWVPGNLGDGSLDGIGVLQKHHCLS